MADVPEERKEEEKKPVAHVRAFYETVNRSSLGNRANSRLFHLRQFNNWCKAMQILEVNPSTLASNSNNNNNINRGQKLRILDLACGKGGDLKKWARHNRGIQRYVGVDAVLPSLKEAAKRSQEMRRPLSNMCTFVCADLGEDALVAGQDQELYTWSPSDEAFDEQGLPDFKKARGGGIRANEKFDVISMQFALHYMFATQDRAKRFFKTIGELLDVGGSFIATTIDARVVIKHLMNLGFDLHPSDQDDSKTKAGHSSHESNIELSIGDGACRLAFRPDTIQRIFDSSQSSDPSTLFGLEYMFQLVEGSDQAAGVGDAVNVPEYLLPLPVLKALAREVGLEMDYLENLHEFFGRRAHSPLAINLLHDMKVPNWKGSLSRQEWDICRLYCALKFTRRSDQQPKTAGIDTDKMMPQALKRAKQSAGEVWCTLPNEKKQRLVAQELENLK